MKAVVLQRSEEKRADELHQDLCLLGLLCLSVDLVGGDQRVVDEFLPDDYAAGCIHCLDMDILL